MEAFLQFLIKKKKKKFLRFFFHFLVIKTLDPGSLEMLDTDPYPQHWFSPSSTGTEVPLQRNKMLHETSEFLVD